MPDENVRATCSPASSNPRPLPATGDPTKRGRPRSRRGTRVVRGSDAVSDASTSPGSGYANVADRVGSRWATRARSCRAHVMRAAALGRPRAESVPARSAATRRRRPGRCDDDRQAPGLTLAARLELVAVPAHASSCQPHLLNDRDPIEIGALAHRPHGHALRAGAPRPRPPPPARSARSRGPRHEPRGDQPLREVGGSIVRVELPLERLTTSANTRT